MHDSHTWTINVTEWYFFFSEGSNGAGKKEFVSQFACWQSHFYMKCKWWINDK